jgi:glucan biosynthesis protein C
MPIAYYASWQLTVHNRGFLDFYEHLGRSGFVPGPPWFIWVLLLFDVVLALLLRPLSRWAPPVGHFMRSLKEQALATFMVTLVVAATAYLPLLSRYGFWTWTNVGKSPLSFQIARVGLYAVWFVFGFLVGAPGFSNGLIARSGSLARHWPWWVAGCLLAYNALWFVPRSALVASLPHARRGGLAALLWLVSCVASCFAFLAFFRGVDMKPRSWLLSLSRAAYVMFLVHYVYVLWAQRAMLGVPIHAGFKFVFVFSSATVLSWLTAQLVLRIPKLHTIL